MSKSYFGYVRVSTVRQGEGVSLDAQKEAIERYCAQQGLSLGQVFEEKETAAKQGRPVFADLISRLHRGDADGVVMHKIDRSARNLRDWATVGDLQDAGIDVHFAAESVDFASRGGRLTADIQAVIAADYIRNLREETIKGVKGRLKQGLYPFKAPIGYLDNGGGKVKTIDPERGLLVRQTFELYATGEYSFTSLADEMTRRGLTGQLGKRVYKGKIERILSNPFYIGMIEVLTTGETYQGVHEPLISVELYRRVQSRRLGRANKKRTKHNYLYRGLFKCVDCHNSMIPEQQRRHVYYRCHTRKCQTTTVREDVIEQEILSTLSRLEVAPDLTLGFSSALEDRLRHLAKTTNRSTVSIERATLDAQRGNLVNALVNGTIDDETYKAKEKQLQLVEVELLEKSNVRQKRDVLGRHLNEFLEHAKSLVDIYVLALAPEKRQLVELVFSNRTISGRKPLFQLQDWIVEAVDLDNGLYCGLYDAATRSGSDFPAQEILARLELLTCPELRQVTNICSAVVDRQRIPKLPISYHFSKKRR